MSKDLTLNELEWIKEFYPASAADPCTDKEAIEHTLRKWKGLRASSLAKHGLAKPPIPVNGSTCALCHLNDFCKTCVLYKLEGSCDVESEDGIAVHPYWIYKTSRDPEPMIKSLEYLQKDLE